VQRGWARAEAKFTKGCRLDCPPSAPRSCRPRPERTHAGRSADPQRPRAYLVISSDLDGRRVLALGEAVKAVLKKAGLSRPHAPQAVHQGGAAELNPSPSRWRAIRLSLGGVGDLDAVGTEAARRPVDSVFCAKPYVLMVVREATAATDAAHQAICSIGRLSSGHDLLHVAQDSR